MPCQACASFTANRASGAYSLRCLHCCARLIASARPLRRLQEGHIAACQRQLGDEWTRLWPRVQQHLRDNSLDEEADV
jgi:hypothetical protein